MKRKKKSASRRGGGILSVDTYSLMGDPDAPNGILQLVDAEMTRHPHRFYRAVQTNVPSVRLAVFSDPHYMATNLLVDGSSGLAFQTYLAQDRKMLAQSAAILDAVVEGITNATPDIVLVPGDLTKDGELVSHQGVTNVLQRLRNAGAKVFVCPGNHDVNNPHALSFNAANTESVPSVSSNEFAALYTNYGYGEAIARDPNSLAYVADPVPGLRILAMDSCHYELNTNGTPVTKGYLDATRLTWITNQLAVARDEGKFVIGMIHHGIMEHYVGQKALFTDYVLDDYQAIDRLFAAYGMKVVFTGHYHAQDITQVDMEAGRLFDIETGSTVTYPCPYRIVDLASNGVMAISSRTVTNINYDLGGTDFQTFAYTFLQTGMLGLSSAMLQMPPYSLPAGTANFLAPAVTEGFMAHYAGDEPGIAGASAGAQAIIASLMSGDAMSQMLGGGDYFTLHGQGSG